LDNFLIFDVSSSTLFYCGKVQDDNFLVRRNFPKGEMNRKLPEIIKDIRKKIEGRDITVVVGTGPGSFTGLKTGLAMFLGMLYSVGIKKIRTVSSLRLFFLLSEKTSDYTISVSPFNKDEFFFTLIDRDGKTVVPDRHSSPPYAELAEAAYVLKGSSVNAVSSGKIQENIRTVLTVAFGDLSFHLPSLCDEITTGDFEELDITVEPLLLNYVAYPANIKDSMNIYVNSIERSDMKIENLSVNEINDKLKKLREEHRRFDEMSDSLAQKSYLTPTDEMELNQLRKKKLLKKDMISYYENILEKQSS